MQGSNLTKKNEWARNEGKEGKNEMKRKRRGYWR